MKSKGPLFYSVLFVVTLLAQGLLFDQIEPGWGIHIMVYPMFILLLPFEIRPVNLMLLAFILGISVDAFTNSFGLHASSSVFLAYIRPRLYASFEPRDGYEASQLASLGDMKRSWFIRTYGIALLIHHFVFFSLEIFKFSQFFFVLQKTLLSAVFSLLVIFILQQLFLNSSNKS